MLAPLELGIIAATVATLYPAYMPPKYGSPTHLTFNATKGIYTRVLELLERMGLSKRTTHKPVQFSGGEPQLVAFAPSLNKNLLLPLDVLVVNFNGEQIKVQKNKINISLHPFILWFNVSLSL